MALYQSQLYSVSPKIIFCFNNNKIAAAYITYLNTISYMLIDARNLQVVNNYCFSYS